MSREVDILVVGAGQGGLSVSWYLRQAGREHLVVDRGGIGHAWDAQRWDSFCLVTPNWTINLPGRPYAGDDPDGFMSRDAFVEYLRDWARSFAPPLAEGVEVTRIRRAGEGFDVATSDGRIRARSVVVATATYQHPRVPALAALLPADIAQFHAESYKSPAQAAPGGVLVVGTGQTGCQVAEDFLRAGRRVYLSVSRTGRLPRRHRGRDCIAWQKDMGLLDRTPDMLDRPERRFVGDPHLTGRDRGATICLRDFDRRGATLLGRLAGVRGRRLEFADDLHASLAFADAFAADFRRAVDAHIAAAGVAAPAPTSAKLADVPAEGAAQPPVIDAIDLDAAGIGTVVWATGFTYDFGWIDELPVDAQSYPLTEAGQSPLPGLYFCGLNWMTRRKSGILYGVAEDAREVARRLCLRHAAPPSRSVTETK